MHVQKVKEQEKAYNKQVRVFHSFIYLFLINHSNLSLTTVLTRQDKTRQDKTMFYVESYTVLCISTLSK